jgi:prenyltransferase beta subunit
MRLAHPVRLAVVLVLVALVLAAGAVLAFGAVLNGSRQSAPPRALRAGAALAPELAYLAGAQNADGGFGAARGQASTELYTAWAAIGLAAAGRNPLALRSHGHTVLDAIRAEAGSLQGAGDLERTILALHACGVSTHALGPAGDPVRRLLGMRAGDGSFGHLSNLTAFAILALRAAGERAGDTVVRGAARWLARQQDGDGGFGFATRGEGSDVDDTAAVVQALAAAGVRGRTLARAATYLVRAQNPDGGFPQQSAGASNAQSTAWAIQGLTAAGRNASRLTRDGSRSPLAYLQSLLAPDGSVRYSRTGSQTPVWVTAQALTGLAARPLPIAAPAQPRGSG